MFEIHSLDYIREVEGYKLFMIDLSLNKSKLELATEDNDVSVGKYSYKAL